MSDKQIDEGGPAFPIPKSDLTGSYDAAPGMTLRDWFAGQALQGAMASWDGVENWKAEDMAVLCYARANAMIIVRTLVNQPKQ